MATNMAKLKKIREIRHFILQWMKWRIICSTKDMTNSPKWDSFIVAVASSLHPYALCEWTTKMWSSVGGFSIPHATWIMPCLLFAIWVIVVNSKAEIRLNLSKMRQKWYENINNIDQRLNACGDVTNLTIEFSFKYISNMVCGMSTTNKYFKIVQLSLYYRIITKRDIRSLNSSFRFCYNNWALIS